LATSERGQQASRHANWGGKVGGGGRPHNDAALDPQVVVLKQPDLNFLSALQKPENQVLQAGGIDQLVACPGSSLSVHQ
jgi:hypothetical protein